MTATRTRRILVDATATITAGALGHVRSLLIHFDEKEDLEFHVLWPSHRWDDRPSKLRRIRFVRVPMMDRLAPRVVLSCLLLPWLALWWKADLIFSPFDIGPLLSFVPVLLGVKTPNAVLRADESSLRFPRIHRFVSKQSVRTARLVVFPSRFASEVLGPPLGVPESRRRVVHHAFDPTAWRASLAAQLPADLAWVLDRPYLFFWSWFYRFKNVELLLEGFARARRQAPERRLRLVLAGAFVDRAYEARLLAQIDTLGIADDTILLGHRPMTVIGPLVRESAALVIPTRLETFGHMYLEALASSRPTLVADIPVARELLGHLVQYVDVSDPRSLAQALTSDIAVPQAEDAQERLRSFTGRREADGMLALLRSAAGTDDTAPVS